MATQTPSQRQAAAKKAAATRKRNATKRSAAATKTSARRTRTSASAGARQTTRDASRTTKQATRTAGRGLEHGCERFGAIGRQAQRALLIQVGAAATLGDKVRQTARNYSELRPRPARAGPLRAQRRADAQSPPARLTRRRRELKRDVRSASRELESRVERSAERREGDG